MGCLLEKLFFRLLIFTCVVSIVGNADFKVVCVDKLAASVGNNVTLQCILSPSLDATYKTVKWIRKGAVIHQRGNDSQNEDFKGRTSLSSEGLKNGNLSLTISSVKLSDRGNYQCCFSSGPQEVKCSTQLFVDGLKIKTPDHPISAAENETVILPCQTDPEEDVSLLTVEWEMHWETIHVRGSTGTRTQKTDSRTSLFLDQLSKGNISLKITNVTKNDSGIYTCKIVVDSVPIGKGNVTLEVVSGDKGEQEEDKGLNAWKIADIVVAVVVVVVGVLLYKRRRASAAPGNVPSAQSPHHGTAVQMEEMPSSSHDAATGQPSGHSEATESSQRDSSTAEDVLMDPREAEISDRQPDDNQQNANIEESELEPLNGSND